MPDGNALQGIRCILRDALRKQVHDLVIQAEQALGDGETHGGGGESLGHGIEDVCRIGHEQFFFQHLPVLKNHDAVQVFGAVGNGLEIGGECLVHVGGSLSARERPPAAGAGGTPERLQDQPAPVREKPEDCAFILSAQVIGPALHDLHSVVHSLIAGPDGVRGDLRERKRDIRDG